MDFSHDPEQVALREAVRGLLSAAYGDFERRRAVTSGPVGPANAADPGYDAELWERLADMGVLGLPYAEEDGGMGAGPVEVAIVAQEVGRLLAPEPFLASVVLAGGVVAAAGTAAQRADVLGAAAAGASLLAFAHAEPGTRWSPSASGVSATGPGAGRTSDAAPLWTLTGVKEPVLHGATADLLVVSARLEAGGTGLFLVRPDAPGVSRTGYRTHDGGRAARVALDSAPADPLGPGGADASAAIAEALDLARVAACNEAVGAMEFQLATTAAYLQTRRQFGVPLKTFQALTFRAADMYVSLELAKSTTLWATMVAAARPGPLDARGAPPDPLPGTAARAALQVSRAARHVGQEAIQLHGGIAMTAEYSVGAYTSRLTALDHLLGDGRLHLSRLAAGVGTYDELDPLV